MKKIEIVFSLTFLASILWLTSFGQKQLIDTNVYRNWPSLGWEAGVNNNGTYAFYSIENHPVGHKTLILQSLHDTWKLEIPGYDGYSGIFTTDGKKAIFKTEDDKLGTVILGDNTIQYVSSIISFKLPAAGSGKWLAYHLAGKEKKMVLRNLQNGELSVYDNVDEYLFDPKGNVLVLKTLVLQDTAISESIEWCDLQKKTIQSIWKGKGSSNLIIDEEGKQMAFTVKGPDDYSSEKSVWYYKTGQHTATQIINGHHVSETENFFIDNLASFNKKGNQLHISIAEKKLSLQPNPQSVPLSIWSYTDTKLQSQQMNELDNDRSYSAIVDLSYEKIYRIEHKYDESEQVALNAKTGNVFLISHTEGDPGLGESNWNKAANRSWNVLFPKEGKKITLDKLNNYSGGSVKLSPDGTYSVYYDPTSKNYFSYEIASGKICNISKGISTSWINIYANDLPLSDKIGRGIAGWSTDNTSVLLYDRYDIWLLDLKGKKSPRNITNSYGKNHNIIFFLALKEGYEIFHEKQLLILNAFNLDTKENGFYSKSISATGDPELLSMGPYLYNLIRNPYVPDNANYYPKKAKNTLLYIVRRMSETTSPNFFVTSDFRTFKPLSNLNPENSFNWIKAELNSWKMLDGRVSQGILYKPENFDPLKKYPVIFCYYERKSDGLHYFLKPEGLTGGCNVNIPTYVSNGYLVFSPDIYYTVGDPMQGTYDAVVSAAQYVAKLPFVNEKKMGIQGCSFGGVQTNYLITRTNLFSAAVSAASISDFVSSSGSVGGNGASLRGLFEIGQTRMGYSLWERPDLYLKNSAVFHADKVTSPILLVQSRNDGVCLFTDVLEFFTGLRRLGKKAWLLEYSEGRHGVHGRSGDDFSVRMQQFFDHYLKNKPAPVWMTRGIPAIKKGIETGLELDTVIKTPGAGLLMQEPKPQ